MKMVNLWDLTNITGLEFTSDINKLLELIRTGQVTTLKIQDRFELGDTVNSTFESIFAKKGVGINYVSDERPILISSNDILSNFISTKFYHEHEQEIKEAYQQSYENINRDYVSIPSFAYSPGLIDILIRKKVSWVSFYDVELTEEDIKKLKDNFISATVYSNGEAKEVSTNFVVGSYSMEHLKNEKALLLSLKNIIETNLDNVKYLNSNTTISILPRDEGISEEHYYKVVKELLEHLSKTGKHFVVDFPVNNRSVFKKVFNEERFNNVELFLKNDLYNYPYEEYLEEEKKLDKLIEPIKSKDLSPLERYLAVYNIVKNFKPYKESPNQLEDSRYIRYILNNEYMVCVGYAKLLEVLCEKVGIRTTDLSIGVDISYDKDKSASPIPVEYGGHARCMVSIDDDKYGVHGVYISDPTWDNELSENRLNHALMTSARIVTGKRMLFYNMYETILDINNFDDFNKQVNYLFKKHYAEVKKSNSLNLYDYFTFQEQVRMKQDSRYNEEMTEKVRVFKAYKNTINAILKPITCETRVEDFYKKLNECKTEEAYVKLLNEIGNYLLTRINQPVANETIIQASVNATSIIKGLSDKEKEEEYERTRKHFYNRELIQFPYQVDDPNNLAWKTK